MTRGLILLGAWLSACPPPAVPCAFPSSAVVIAPNLDDDDRDGRIDGVQVRPSFGDDELITFDLPPTCTGRLTVDAPMGEVRLWATGAGGWTAAEVLERSTHRLAVEVVRGRSAGWNGRAVLRLSGVDGGLVLETPPFVLRTPETPVSEVWAAEVTRADALPTTAMLEALEAALPRPVTLRRLRSDAAGADRWVQDAFQSAIVGTRSVVIRLPRAGPTRGLSELSFATGLPPSIGVVGTGVLAESRFDYGGNLEVLSPHGRFPSGRLIIGGEADGPTPELLSWLEAQGVQTPALRVPTSWLESGHVDDVLMPVPSASGTVRVLFASPALGLSAVATKDAALVAFNRSLQRRLDDVESSLRGSVAPAPLDVVRLPVLFRARAIDGGTVATPLVPNPVNALVLGATIFAGTLDGGDAALLRGDADRRLRDAGFVPHWLDVSAYAPHGGSVHCAVEVIAR